MGHLPPGPRNLAARGSPTLAMSERHGTSVILAGRYRLGPAVGQGANGAVYRAEDLGRGGRQVALKVTRSVTEGQAFRSPAAAVLADFLHPNWAEVIDTGTVSPDLAQRIDTPGPRRGGGAWFQVQRFVSGTSLDRLEGPQDPELVWKFLEDGARVLQALHDLEIIHYDVTPSNWLFERRSDGPHFTLTDGSLARVGALDGPAVGTPIYMAPELTQSKGHDHRVDLYSLGLVAYRLLTGQHALGDSDDDPIEIVDRRRSQDVPRPSAVLSGVPQELDILLHEMLAREPNARPRDGRAVLRRIADLRAMEVPEVLSSEAYARVQSGPMIGQEKVMERGRLALADLARQLAPWSGVDSRRADDNVLILTGPSGSGTTRIARELHREARAHDLPVLLLAGRDGAPDPEAPLDLLFESAVTLWKTGRRSADVLPGDSPEIQVVEAFVDGCLTASKTTPFVVLIEDFGDLPPTGQVAVAALCRELISRSVHAAGELPPPVSVIVDVGPFPPGPLLIPDSHEPLAPLLAAEHLDTTHVRDLLDSRLGGPAQLPETDVQRVAETTRGLAGSTQRLLAEAAQRGDLIASNGAWTWQLSELREYTVQPKLPPEASRALELVSNAERTLLACLALTDRPVSASVMKAICASLRISQVPAEPLVAQKLAALVESYSLTHASLRPMILQGLPKEAIDRARNVLLSAFLLRMDSRTLLPAVKLCHAVSGPLAAWQLFLQNASIVPHRDRDRLLREIETILVKSPELLTVKANRTALAKLLPRSHAALPIAKQLAPHIQTDGSELPNALRTYEVLADLDSPEYVAQQLQLHARAATGTPADRCDLYALLAKVLHDAHRYSEARQATSLSLRLLRGMRRATPARDRLSYLVSGVLARCHVNNEPRRAEVHLIRGIEAAQRCGDLAYIAQLHNNLGIVKMRSDATEAAAQHFEQSITAKEALGDLIGAAWTRMNLCRGLRESRAGASLIEAGQSIAACVARAQRHGLRGMLVHGLMELAATYDQQYRSDLAFDLYLRAWRTTQAGDDSTALRSLHPHARIHSDQALSAAWQLAPLASARGRYDVAATLLQFTAGAARADRLRDPTGKQRSLRCGMHYLTAALSSLHSGQSERFAFRVRRALKYSGVLPRAQRRTLSYAAYVASLPSQPTEPRQLLSRPGREGDRLLRSLFRVYLWVQRLRSQDHGSTAQPVVSHKSVLSIPPIPPGAPGRVAAELLLAAAFCLKTVPSGSVLSSLDAFARMSSFTMLGLRAKAARAYLDRSANPGTWAFCLLVRGFRAG